MNETSLSVLPGSEADELGDNTASDSRRKVLALGAAVVLALGAGGFVLLSGGGEPDGLAVGVPPPAPVAAAPSASPTPTPVPTLEAAPAGVARDPFRRPDGLSAAAVTEPVVQAPPVVEDAGAGNRQAADDGAVPADGVVGGGTGVVTGPVPGSTGPGTWPATGPAPTRPPEPVPTAPVSRRLVLTSVTGTADTLTAELTLDGLPVVVAVGARFGPSSDLLLVSLQEGPADGQWTAVVQHRDGEPFDVGTDAPVTVL